MTTLTYVISLLKNTLAVQVSNWCISAYGFAFCCLAVPVLQIFLLSGRFRHGLGTSWENSLTLLQHSSFSLEMSRQQGSCLFPWLSGGCVCVTVSVLIWLSVGGLCQPPALDHIFHQHFSKCFLMGPVLFSLCHCCFVFWSFTTHHVINVLLSACLHLYSLSPSFSLGFGYVPASLQPAKRCCLPSCAVVNTADKLVLHLGDCGEAVMRTADLSLPMCQPGAPQD